ncbi:MAG TPA: Yip1 family protein [Phenylobacterium sp.]|jgi:hypothetical protein|nr:Yip1 family protein [Phenylobacterium sp.]
MNAAEPSSQRAGLLWRPLAMLLRPGRTLDAVADHHADSVALYVGYVLPLAAIGPVCGTIGLLVFGGGIAGIHMKMDAWPTILLEVLNYVFSLIGVYLLALAIAVLGPLFGATGGRLQALKLVAYACTAVWVAGLFAVYPTLGFAMMLLGGIYSLYALYLGLGPVMRAPADKALTFFAAILGAALVIGLVLRLARGRTI